MYASESDVVMFDDFHGAVRQRGHLTLSAATLGHQVEEEALPTGRVTVLRTRLPVFGSHNANPVSAGSSGASTAGAPATKAVLRMGTPSIAQHDKDSVGRVRIVHTAGPSSAVPGWSLLRSDCRRIALEGQRQESERGVADAFPSVGQHLSPASAVQVDVAQAGLSGGDARSRVKVGGRFPFTTEPPLDVSLVPDGGDA
ncbi:hypothetical protein AK812_SmicGene31321 [Symbiodinium microadriaticum]|uniref:Uncharacterized protein n=1 Tax=Symbiodinium microadriaticum TaxID=2951 RepID=A0A1Q9CX01_SYMMI|nr:hypothetical protein AK812_SmicGene31321 [Symbiodinium microadriaticum]